MKKYISLSLTILCAICIYCNSLMNADISSAQSGIVLNLIKKAAGTIGLPPARLTEHLIRKLAHFCEYALLGFLMTLTIKLWNGKLKPHIFTLLFFGLLISVTDEFLKLFVEGRAGMVQDVVLDFAGVIAGVAIYTTLVALKLKVRKRFKM